MSSSDAELNLVPIKKSRLKQGDIFALSINGIYLFGRVVNDKVPMMGSQLALVYVYNVQSHEPSINLSELTPDKLLLQPFITFPALWNKGFAMKVGHELDEKHNVLPQHYFRTSNNRYVDEFGNPIEAIDDRYNFGTWSVMSLGLIDDNISDALGIKRKPLQYNDLWYISGSGNKIWQKYPISELQKYANYEEVISKYPEVIER